MTVQEYLTGVGYQDEAAMIIVERAGYGTQNVADIRGFGYLEKVAKLPNVVDFQDEVGRYIVQAIKEKNEREASNVSNNT